MIKHIIKGLVVVPIAMLVMVFAVAPVSAAEFRGDDTVIIASGDVIDDDLYVASDRTTINGTINGDVLAAGDTITVNGKINGSIIAVGSTINIDGEVTNAARVAGGNVNISGNVGGDLVVAGGQVDIASTAVIGRDLVFGAGNIQIDAPIGDDVKGGGGEVTIKNGVAGNVEIKAKNLTLDSAANIKGNLIYISENEVEIQPGAKIGGTTIQKVPESKEPVAPKLGMWGEWGKVIAFLMTLLAGTVIILIAPQRATAVAISIRRKPWLSLGWGAIILFATPIAAIVTLITVIGVPVALIGLTLYGIAIYLSQIAVGLFIGYWIISYFSNVESRGILVGALALGLTVLTLLKLIPYVGFPLWLATVLFGIGAMTLSQKTMRAGAPAEVSEML
ncbi:hypothetical protein ACFLTZ_03325 [Chloroflexota bacterium]